MNKDIFQKEFDKIFPNHKQNLDDYKKHLTEKYGEEEVRKMESISGIVDECLSNMIKDLL